MLRSVPDLVLARIHSITARHSPDYHQQLKQHGRPMRRNIYRSRHRLQVYTARINRKLKRKENHQARTTNPKK